MGLDAEGLAATVLVLVAGGGDLTALAGAVTGLADGDLALTANLEVGMDLGLAEVEASCLALTGAAFTGLTFTGTDLSDLAFGTGLAATVGFDAALFFWATAAVLTAFGAALVGAFLGVVTSCLLAV